MTKPDLSAAVAEGKFEVIQSLLDAGADVRYVRPRGYTVLIDVMYGSSIAEDDQLLPVLRLLIERGADLNAVSEYGESALSVASGVGRFDSVQLLLNAGADPKPLKWTPLLRAVALGSTSDVESQIRAGADLEAQDRWDRTAWLLSVQSGDLAKAELLLAAGANREMRGRCGKTPLMYAVGNKNTVMLRWLLDRGADPNETDQFGGTALIEAAQVASAECVRMLLGAGADVNHCCNSNSAIQQASSLDVARILIDAGADLNDINGGVRAILTRLPYDNSVNCTLAEYREAKHRVYGTANPQRMNFPFWIAMVAGGASAYHGRAHFEPGKVDDEAVWCFARYGKSINELPDGRVIEIAGEHEDSYDPDFCIFNDVIVHRGNGTFDIYGYPPDIFPPTDFHTATLVGNFIYIIGNLGYPGSGQHGATPVYRLDINSLAIEPVETSGDAPGWISRHKARLVRNGIVVTRGKVFSIVGDKELYEDNPNTYILDLATGNWSRQGKKE